MLTHLSIRDVVLIEKLDLTLAAGLTVLTGETGAGKSILLDSLGLALGDRANAGLIRSGAAQASVAAIFEVPSGHPVFTLLSEQGIALEEASEPLVLRRIVTPDGRSRAYVSDQPVGISLLRRIASQLVEIQGQHEQMGLADQSTHLNLLDAFGVKRDLLARTAATFHQWANARTALAKARSEMDAAAREEEWLRATVDDLSTLAPQEGEEESLAALRVSLQQDERRGEAVAAALSELTPRDRRSSNPSAALRSASRALVRLLPSSAETEGSTSTHQAQAQEALDALEKAEEALAEAEMLLTRLAADTESDPRLLEETEERLFSLRAEARKHNVSVAELPSFLASLKSRLAALDSGNAELSRLEIALTEARLAYEEAAKALSKAREHSAQKLEQAVSRELKPVKLERARFIVSLLPLAPEQWNSRGMEQSSFLIAANPGQAPGPLAKVASGGELSRLMLALKVVLAQRSDVGTLVFDEVDSGVGGATASSIGDRLHKVAQDVQVLVVTHSPQVAARGDHHLRIAKRIRNERTETLAEPLSREARREEIARMLAGDVITDAARGAADSLLEQTA
ncbi:DNA repair protein RecN [Gluconobacter cerinus]|uniref:DNA repair protein RecN n=1 Tax=Gluconobacter cerinus TaxID=38307 RepID=A0AAV5NB67_9PROT|nr:DNA repair protein RecN [Gluconobacter cerinus]MBS1041339.1 DNA repair protein RecN [Gluconobacter cerinus]MBS1047600.1 DNA repair protein RecN [Gluconobacter cerinus]MBS1070946.1 DNA repair protein RecN [Gluconobacter cerinus]GBR02010.1 DNA repair protein RecN [Gluconobacter cerinus NRIC 0229]GLQ61224.1 DNA repair protein RecN [Gluconobacter cerinus]